MEPVAVPDHIQKLIEEDRGNSSTSRDDKSEDGGRSSEDWTELDQEGWENVLGSGRLRRRIINAAEVQETCMIILIKMFVLMAIKSL